MEKSLLTMNKPQLELYAILLGDIKNRIRQAQVKATLSANGEMIAMYWDIGKMIQERQQLKGWSAAVIPRLSRDIRNELPEIKGFSERSIGRMLSFYRHYPILPQAVAKLGNDSNLPQPLAKIEIQDLVLQIPWGHKDLKAAFPHLTGFSHQNLFYIRKWHHFFIARNLNQLSRKLRDNWEAYLCSKLLDNYNHLIMSNLHFLCLCLGRTTKLFWINVKISEYILTHTLPDSLKNLLPSTEALERELDEGFQLEATQP